LNLAEGLLKMATFKKNDKVFLYLDRVLVASATIRKVHPEDKVYGKKLGI
jgi:hypothetical protein